MPQWKGRRAESNNGWKGYGPWPYTILEEDDLAKHVERLSGVRKEGVTEYLTFQPYPKPDKNQDRFLISQWDSPKGPWKVFYLFDGHAGHETVDHAIKSLPSYLESVILSSEGRGDTVLPATKVIELLKTAISTFDEDMAKGMTDLFPGGPNVVAQMSDDDIRSITLVDGQPHTNILPCLAGTTVLIALLDPARQLYVASVGDSHAVLGIKNQPEDGWQTTIVSAHHNGGNSAEVERLKTEHPGEEDLIKRDRVFGDIAVTRALGDFVFKLPATYTQRVLKTTCPDAYILTKVDQFLPRYLTPPYLSNVADVQHVDLSAVTSEETVLVLASDGLTDMWNVHEELPLSLAEEWIRIVSQTERPALGLLREALGGKNRERASFYLTVEMDQVWVDDTTIIVTKL